MHQKIQNVKLHTNLFVEHEEKEARVKERGKWTQVQSRKKRGSDEIKKQNKTKWTEKVLRDKMKLYRSNYP